MKELRALTLWQPWATVVALGLKPIENRPWAPWRAVVGKRIAIHAGKVWDPVGEEMVRRLLPDFDLIRARVHGAILGTVVVDYAMKKESPDLQAPRALITSPWFFGPWGWVLSDARPLTEPIACKGAMALWKVPEEITARIHAP